MVIPNKRSGIPQQPDAETEGKRLPPSSPRKWWRTLPLFFLFLFWTLPLSSQSIQRISTEGESGESPLFIFSTADSVFSAPDTVFIGLTRIGRCDTLHLPIANRSTSPIRIDSISFSSSSASLQLLDPPVTPMELQPGKRSELLIVFCPTETFCTDGVLRIEGRQVTSGEPVTHYTGINACGGYPSMIVDSSSIDFGSVYISECRVDSLTIRNTGNYPLRITGIRTTTMVSQVLSPATFPFTLQPNEIESIVVQFCPDRKGTLPDTLVIESNADGSPNLIPLQGSGSALRMAFPDTLDVGEVQVNLCRDTFLIVQNISALPITLEEIRLKDHPSEQSFSLAENYPSGWNRTLQRGDTLHIPIRFCPGTFGEIINPESVTFKGSFGETGEVVLRGKGRLTLLGFSNTTFDFGSLPVGRCRDTSILLHNHDNLPVELSAISLDQLLPSDNVLILDQLSFPIILDPEDSLTLHIRFCPKEEGNVERRMRIVLSGAGEEVILLSGTGILPLIWLDSTHTNAGEKGSLTLRLWPVDIIRRGEYSLEFQVDPDALFTTEIEGNGSITHHQDARGTIAMTGTAPDILPPDGALLKITFLGLGTGQPVNRVHITSIDLADSIARWDTLDGVVTLSGCEVGRLPGTGKRASIRSLQPNPASGDVTLIYQSPEGRTSLLTLYDSRGERVDSITLPEGTGQPEEISLELEGYPRGLYMLELVERGERHIYPLLID